VTVVPRSEVAAVTATRVVVVGGWRVWVRVIVTVFVVVVVAPYTLLLVAFAPVPPLVLVLVAAGAHCVLRLYCVLWIPFCMLMCP
jgi:hypothetical protein